MGLRLTRPVPDGKGFVIHCKGVGVGKTGIDSYTAYLHPSNDLITRYAFPRVGLSPKRRNTKVGFGWTYSYYCHHSRNFGSLICCSLVPCHTLI